MQFDAHQGIDNPDESALVERYESQTAFAEHRRTPHFRRNVETELVGLLTARSRRCSGQLCDAT
jgi:quinol monooxygenase YgiN